MTNIIKFILIFLLIFTPIAFGSMELWAFSLMELGILLIIILFSFQSLFLKSPFTFGLSTFTFPLVFLSLFLLLILFQMLPLPTGLIKLISPKTYSLYQSLSLGVSAFGFQPSTLSLHLSFVPFLTRIEFFKWLTLSGLFIYLLFWKGFSLRTKNQFILVIFIMGVAESLYGMFEFFSGHRHILHIDMSETISSVTGTFTNRNYFAGYLLMVIPLSMGYLFYRESKKWGDFWGWRNRLSNLDGKTVLIAFGIIVMILGLLFSASRMGIASLMLSFTLLSLVFRNPHGGKRLSRSTILIFGLALLWAIWIGLDAVISRFFETSEGLKARWVFWLDTIKIFKDYPLFGTGLGTFIQVFPMYRCFHVRGLATHGENDLLQLVSEVGVLGIGLLITLFIYLFYKTVSKIRSFSFREGERYIGIGGLVGLLALMFHSLVERNIQVPANAFLYTVIFAIIISIPFKQTKQTR